MHPIPIHAIANINEVKFADGSTTRTNNITEPVSISIQNNSSKESFIVLPLATYDAILGMPYLKKFNPTIDWNTHSIQFTTISNSNNCNAMSQSDSKELKQKNKLTFSKSKENSTSIHPPKQERTNQNNQIRKQMCNYSYVELHNKLKQTIELKALNRKSSASIEHTAKANNTASQLCVYE